MAQQNRGGKLLNEWRVLNKYSQWEAAGILEIHPQMISRYECGSGIPGRRGALKIAEKTGGAVSVGSWDEAA